MKKNIKTPGLVPWRFSASEMSLSVSSIFRFLLFSCLIGVGVNPLCGQMDINEADDILCQFPGLDNDYRLDSILHYSNDLILTFEKAGDWESYVQALLYKGGALRDKRSLPEAQSVLERALFVAMTSLEPGNPLFATLYSNLGLLALWGSNGPDAAIWFTKQIKAEGDSNSTGLAGAEINLGLVYYYLSRYEESRTHNEIGIKILKESGNEEHAFISNAYLNIGLCYYAEDQYDLALTYFEQALEFLLNSSNPRATWLANIYGNISNMHYFKGDFDKALYFMNKSLEMHRSIWGENHTWIAHCLHNLGNFYSEKGDNQQAIAYALEALEMRKKLLPIHHTDIARTHELLGQCYAAMGDKELALETFRQGIANRSQVDPRDKELVKIYMRIARILESEGEFEEAVKELDKAIYILKPVDDIKQVKNHSSLLQALEDKASVLLAYAQAQEENHQLETRKTALSLYREACEISNFVQRQRHDELSKSKMARSGQILGKKGLDLAFELYQKENSAENLNQICWFMENNKASLLHEAVQKNRARILAGIPDSLLALERNLSLDFTFYDQKLQHELSLGKDADTLKVKEYKQKTFAFRLKRDSLRDQLEKQFPAFQYLNFEARQTELAQIQAHLLATKEILLEYAFTDSALFLLAVSSEEAKAIRLEWSSAQENQLKAFITLLQNTHQAQNEGFSEAYQQNFAALAASLYEQLVAPAMAYFPQAEILNIIPDGMLGYLPYEVLLTARPKSGKTPYNEWPFLLKKHRIRYNYAAAMPPSEKSAASHAAEGFAAFAPVYQGESLALSREVFQHFASEKDYRFHQLGANQKEVQEIRKLMKGNVWLGEEASKENFLNHAGEYRLLHLAMHAFTNDSLPLQSGLVFSSGADRFLYSYEIYNLPLQAELTVLSACHTGFGRYQQGEGIMSLARAFRYAGSPNIVMSLWQADDESTAQLMKLFYQNLKAGIGKDEALRQAKLDFLAESDKPIPHFWAGFVLMGDKGKVDLGTSFGLIQGLGWGILALILLIGGYGIHRRLK